MDTGIELESKDYHVGYLCTRVIYLKRQDCNLIGGSRVLREYSLVDLSPPVVSK
jgi:hypothetical protein